jgi:hypothetical protein
MEMETGDGDMAKSGGRRDLSNLKEERQGMRDYMSSFGVP